MQSLQTHTAGGPWGRDAALLWATRHPTYMEPQPSATLCRYTSNSTLFTVSFWYGGAVCSLGPRTQGLCSLPGWPWWPWGRGTGHRHLRGTRDRPSAQAGHCQATSGLVSNGRISPGKVKSCFPPLATELRMAAADWSSSKSALDLPVVAPTGICCQMVLCYSGN